MTDICYYCDGAKRDLLSGQPCHECNGTGIIDRERDDAESDWDGYEPGDFVPLPTSSLTEIAPQ